MSIIINSMPTFGAMTNNTVSQLFILNAAINRINAAVANASSGHSGAPGTEYEGPNTLFGVVPSDTPGAQGQAFASAMVTIVENWNTFWDAAQGALDSLDNGTRVLSPM